MSDYIQVRSEPCASYLWRYSNGCGLLMENATDCGKCKWCRLDSRPCPGISDLGGAPCPIGAQLSDKRIRCDHCVAILTSVYPI